MATADIAAGSIPARHQAYSCFNCEEVFARPSWRSAKDARKCCSRKCGFEWQAKVRGAHIAAKHRVSKAKCQGCGHWFVQSRIGHLFCSTGCGLPIKVKTARPCAVCKAPFTPKTTASQRCAACQTIEMKRRNKESAKRTGAKAASRKARKLRLRGVIKIEAVNPLVVLKRDRWTCQLCGIKTPQHLRGSYDDRAPEVDHINPLSQGGEHSYRNTQCACRKCNIAKSGTPMGQLRLFG